MKICMLFFFLVATTFANQSEYLFQQGITFYQNGEYAAAIEQFDKVVQNGYESPELYYNLGNAYFKMGEIGKSILNYERAKRLSPRDPDILFNLNVAQLQIVDKIPSLEMDFYFKVWSNIKNLFSIEQLGIITLIIYIVLLFNIIIRMLVKNRTIKNVSKYSYVPVLVVLLVFLVLFGVVIRESITVRHGIILENKISVMSSPAQDSTEMFALHEGVKVRVMDSSGQYLRIRLSDGKDGWILAEFLDYI